MKTVEDQVVCGGVGSLEVSRVLVVTTRAWATRHGRWAPTSTSAHRVPHPHKPSHFGLLAKTTVPSEPLVNLYVTKIPRLDFLSLITWKLTTRKKLVV